MPAEERGTDTENKKGMGKNLKFRVNSLLFLRVPYSSAGNNSYPEHSLFRSYAIE
jgi:hypothetical protein